MNKAFQFIYATIFTGICVTPLVLLPVLKTDAQIEKRELTEFPSFIEEGKINYGFSTQFESWFNDRMPLRSQMLSAANILKGELLHTSTSNVIVGKDGWLFYDNEGQDYMNTDAMTQNQVNAVAVTLSLIQENVTAKGGRFTFVPAPNKASVYGEYMPYNYIKADENNLSRICKALKENNVNYTDLQQVLTANKDKGVYHRRDSHWNYLGAMIGYNSIMESLGTAHKNYDNAPYKYELTWRADLDKLLYPAGGFMDYQYEYDIAYDDFKFTTPKGVKDNKEQLATFMSDREEGDSNIRTSNKNAPEGSVLYMVRDSFGRALLPMMIDNYGDATFKRTNCPDVASVKEGTDFVYEIVERNLINVISTAPFMYAPERGASSVNAGLKDGGSLAVNTKEEGFGLRIYGGFADDFDMGNARVYLRFTNADTDKVFEAFPIYESSMTGEEGINGFSAIIASDCGLNGDYDLSVISNGTEFKGGKVTVTGIVPAEPEVPVTPDTPDVPETPSKPEQKTDKDIFIEINGAVLTIDADYSKAKDALGTETSPSEVLSSCDPGYPDQLIHYYDGLSIYEKEDDHKITGIEINGGNAVLSGKFKLGDDRKDILDLLGKPEMEDEDSITYDRDGQYTRINFSKDKLDSIYINPGS